MNIRTTGRAIILVMDSFGVGAAPDAEKFGDQGADTFGHIYQACLQGKADNEQRHGPLKLQNLARLGLYELAAGASGWQPEPDQQPDVFSAAYGYASEISFGKDTPSGHWEMAGLPVDFDWGFFPKTIPCFPNDFIACFVEKADVPGILGNKHASGTEIIRELGELHIETGKPVCYTSADSVFQIAAHEEKFGLDRLYHICEIVKELLEPLNIGRVIARPFIGESADNFKRTGNRRDYTTFPHGPTLLTKLQAVGGQVISIGKIADIFANDGISKKIKADGNMALFDATLDQLNQVEGGSLIFTNFVDFDSAYGHRRDVAGYAHALEQFDARLPELIRVLHDDDLVLITADHGCDPTWPGSDHTREFVPVIFFGPGVQSKNLGHRQSFADMGQTLAVHLKIDPLEFGVACQI